MFSTTLLLATLLPFLVTADTKSRTINPGRNADLKSAATNFDRQAILSSDSDWIYDFSTHSNYNNTNGAVITADAATVPALTGMGISISLLRLAGCGMLPPHLHPRATNLVTAITGNTTTYMIGENGVKTVTENLTPMKMTIFPQGSLHVMQNNNCEPALLVSALNSDDAGTLNVLPALFGVPQDIIRAAFSQSGMDTQDVGRDIPQVGTGAIIGSEECKKRCGMAHGKV